MSNVLFIVFSIVAIVCALAMVFARNPVYGAIYLIGALGAIAGIFLVLESPFLATLQVLVYAGAIMVLYLFVIMLLNLGHDPGFRWWKNWRTYVGLALTGLLGYTAFTDAVYTLPKHPPAGVEASFTVSEIAHRMFQDPTLIFLVEALAVLLTIAVVAAIYLGRRLSAREQAIIRRAEAKYDAMTEVAGGEESPDSSVQA